MVTIALIAGLWLSQRPPRRMKNDEARTFVDEAE
jgi:hypothetical protein